MSGTGREARVARGRGSLVADFARGHGSLGAGRRAPRNPANSGEGGLVHSSWRLDGGGSPNMGCSAQQRALVVPVVVAGRGVLTNSRE